MKKLITLLMFSPLFAIAQDGANVSSGVGTGAAQVLPTYRSNYGYRVAAIKRGQPDPGPAQPPAQVCTPSAAEPQWVTAVATNNNNKRVKMQYQIDATNNVCDYCGFKVWGYNNWQNAYGSKDSFGRYIEYLGEKYYF